MTVAGRNVTNTFTADQNFNKYKAIALACDNGATLPSAPATGQWFLHTPTGRKTLMQYTGTAWQPIITIGTTTMYVDGTNGTDSQDKGYGTGTNAFKTVQFAVDQIAGLYSGNITIYIAAGTYKETVTISGKAATGNYSITLDGEMTSVLGSTTVSSYVASNGATQASVTVSGASWTVNAYQNKMLRFTTGAQAGTSRVIDSNTADTITLVGSQTSSVTGSNFVVEDWGTIIDGESSRSTGIYVRRRTSVQLYDLQIKQCTSYCVRVNEWSVCSPNRCNIYNTINGAMGFYIFTSYCVLDSCYFYYNSSSSSQCLFSDNMSYAGVQFCKFSSGADRQTGLNVSASPMVVYGSKIDGFLTGIAATNCQCYMFESSSFPYNILKNCGIGCYTETRGIIRNTTNTQFVTCTVNESYAETFSDSVSIGGKRNTEQLIITGNSSQSSNLLTARNSATNSLFIVNSNGGFVANEQGADTDCRIEGDTATNLLVTDAGLDAVHIGTTTQGVIAKFSASEIVFNDTGLSTLDFRVESDTYDALFVDASNDSAVLMNHASGKIGFFGATPTTKTAVADPSAVTTTETADATYDATEQNMLNNLKADVTALQSKLAGLLDALQSYGIV
jgi:hypothetical protein